MRKLSKYRILFGFGIDFFNNIYKYMYSFFVNIARSFSLYCIRSIITRSFMCNVVIVVEINFSLYFFILFCHNVFFF